jgi:hypothetical protein
VSSSTPIDRTPPRFRLPVEPPTRNLLIASLASIAGACQLFAWALARLPVFFAVLGLILIGIALGLGLAALMRHYRLRWVAYVGADSLSIVNGQRRTVLPWPEVRSVRYADFKLEVTGTDGTQLSNLPVDQTREAHEGARSLEQAIAAHLEIRT